jgi:superfamily II DNA or RNA helicase
MGVREMELRPYQTKVIEDFNAAVAAGTKRVIVVAPTGSGKTVKAAAIIKQYSAALKDVLVLAHRREIINQTSELRLHGISHGIVQAGVRGRPLERVQVASIQTLHRRAIHTDKMDLPRADLLVIDECHHAPAETYRKIIQAYPDAVLLGLTATPCRGDGRGLGGIFQKIIECPQVAELIEQKYLVKTRVYAPAVPDLKGVKVVAGDWVESQLAEKMDQPKLVGDIVTNWHKYSERRKTVCFATGVEHSIHIKDEFVKKRSASRTHRRQHAQGGAGRNTRAAGIRRNRGGR